jgi:hypothetical protein
MLKSIAILLALAVAAPADPAAPAAPATQKLKDPNRIICEREEEIGTRLGGKKICKTAQEWQEWRQQNRDQVETWQRMNTVTGKTAG